MTSMRLLSALLCAVFAGPAAHSPAADDLAVLHPTADGVKPEEAFENWLAKEFNGMIDRRSAAFESMLKSATACRVWQTERKSFFLEQIGGLPPRTPLNPQITGTLQGRGYRIEKLLLETRPSFHLTANLYLPETPAPWPAVLVPCGHSHDGKAAGQYQLACMLLARHGMAAICYDPIGQGERYQILDSTRERNTFEDAPQVKVPHPFTRLMCTTEHTMIGLGSALTGGNVAQFRIWDGMRVIDYLQSRPDILPDKIGCTGNSGGGTETAYLMALDDRIAAAAPGCYLTTFRKLLETKGPQDGEQNIFGQIAFGMDEADYCIMRAPKPTLICAGTRDATFNFDGTMEVFREAKRFYSRLGHPESLDLAAPDAPHGFTLQLREAVTRFMSRWLLDKDVVVREVEPLPDTFDDNQLRNLSQPEWTAEQLQCTPEGQVLLMPGEKSVFQINAATAASLKEARATIWSGKDAAGKRKAIADAIGWTAQSAAPRVKKVGSVERGHCRIEKLVLTVDDGFALPGLLFVPKQPSNLATLYLHGGSMGADAAEGGPIDQRVRQGQVVLAAELRGIGETETGVRRRGFGAGRFGRDVLETFTAYLMGKSYVGMRTADAAAWTAYLKSRAGKTQMVATGEAAIPALHFAALHDDAFESVELRGAISSWESVAGATESFDQAVNVVHGVLRHYDLPDLVDLVGRDRVRLVEPVDPMGRTLQP